MQRFTLPRENNEKQRLNFGSLVQEDGNRNLNEAFVQRKISEVMLITAWMYVWLDFRKGYRQLQAQCPEYPPPPPPAFCEKGKIAGKKFQRLKREIFRFAIF